ncbi:VOC family protein [Salinicoccus albus]|uniref:VOC family protein n=1 Tax=Salinicoccus albus TaxID=418756 RepID=UPI00035FE5FA|nr:VOC family protein [Salinicoccus albus]
MTVKGIHHVSSITKEILDNHDFYTNILGLRLIKKTVNRDDTGMYHLFYGDYKGTPGTEVTFFETYHAPKFQPGTNGISRTYFRVPSMEALEFFRHRFDEKGVYHEGFVERYGFTTMIFEDEEKQRLALMIDPEDNQTKPNQTTEIPKRYAITSIGAVEITVQYLKPAMELLEMLGGQAVDEVSDDEEEAEVRIGNDSVFITEQRDSRIEKEGYGSVHHFAMRVDDEDALAALKKLLDEEKWPNSGIIDMQFFKSVYVEMAGGITLELSTAGPGVTIDEPVETLGESLSVPPEFERERHIIEAFLIPIN